MKRAILSLHDKSRSCELASFLTHTGYNIVSSGGTYNYLHNNGIKNITKVEDVTEFPEILGGRVKTLHPRIFGGILSDVYNNEHSQDLNRHKIAKIDVIVANLYPFKETVERTTNVHEIIENIDIGGHALIRAAAKNYKDNIVLFSSDQYDMFMNNYRTIRNRSEYRRDLARQAFDYISEYDIAISNHFNSLRSTRKKYYSLTKTHDLKYGSNPQQNDASIVTLDKDTSEPFKVLNGDIGYINTLDALYSWQLVREIHEVTGLQCAASFKHTSPAGVSIARPLTAIERDTNFLSTDSDESLSESARAYVLARGSDPKSSFGDFAAVSGHVDESLANILKKEISDGIIARTFSEEALAILKSKKNGKYVVLQGNEIPHAYQEVKLFGNFGVIQDNNKIKTTESMIRDLAKANKQSRTMTRADVIDMQVANTTLKYAQSNSVSLVKNGTVLGIGVGQQSRIDCVRLACNKALISSLRNHVLIRQILTKFKKEVSKQQRVNAIVQYIENDFTKHEIKEWQKNFTENISLLTYEQVLTIRHLMNNITMASDGFLPFTDNVELASKYGVSNIIQPGGSINDDIIREKCKEHNIRMIETGVRNFFH